MAVKWKQESVKELKKRKTNAEFSAENEALREQVEALNGQLTMTQLALCDVYEALVGGVA